MSKFQGTLDLFMDFDLAAVHYLFMTLIKYRLDARRHYYFFKNGKDIPHMHLDIWSSELYHREDLDPEQLLHYGDDNKIA